MQKKLLFWVAVVANTICMVWLTLFLMTLPWLAGDEQFLIWGTSTVKLLNREKPDPNQFAFINTSYDLQLIDRYDEFGFPVGNQAVTDRKKLGDLFHALNNGTKKPAYVLCDIHFVDSTENDSYLGEELGKMKNLVVSAHLGEDGHVEKPIFNNVSYGISDYVLGNMFDGVYKYQLMYEDSLQLTPLKMFADLNHTKVQKKGPFVNPGGWWMLNNFIINYRILQRDILSEESGMQPVSLGELLQLPEEDIQSLVANKIVVIGDFFEYDIHPTIFENMPGPIILVDAYLTLLHRDSHSGFWFFLMVILGYGFLSFLVFFEGDFIEQRIQKRFGENKIASYIASGFSYVLVLSILSIVTFFLFNIHINVIYLAAVFYGMDKGVGYIYKFRTRRKEIGLTPSPSPKRRGGQ